MFPPVSPHKGASIVIPAHNACIFGMETPLRGRSGGHAGTAPTHFVWADYAWAVDIVWVDCAWMVDFVWADYVWVVGFIWADCAWAFDVIWVDCAWTVDCVWG